MATAPMPRVAIEIGSAAEMPEFSASIDFTTVITVAMPTASRVTRIAAASLTGAGRHAACPARAGRRTGPRRRR